MHSRKGKCPQGQDSSAPQSSPSSIPSAQDINVYGSLDERWACKIFQGKNLEDAEKLFRQSSLGRQEDLMWMGIKAFFYYVQACIRYIQSDHSQRDSDIASAFRSLLDFRLDNEGQQLKPVAPLLKSACLYILANYEKFDVDLEIYGDLRPDYQALVSRLSELEKNEK